MSPCSSCDEVLLLSDDKCSYIVKKMVMTLHHSSLQSSELIRLYWNNFLTDNCYIQQSHIFYQCDVHINVYCNWLSCSIPALGVVLLSPRSAALPIVSWIGWMRDLDTAWECFGKGPVSCYSSPSSLVVFSLSSTSWSPKAFSQKKSFTAPALHLLLSSSNRNPALWVPLFPI